MGKRERIIAHSKEVYRRTAAASPAYETIEISGVERHLLVVSTGETDTKSICSLPGEMFHLGDIAFWNEAFWIISEVDRDQTIYARGKMQECNHLLRWLDKSGEIVERYCRAEDDTKYTLGVRNEDNLTLPDTRRRVLIPCDTDTIGLEDGKRLLIDKQVPEPKAYEITNVDRVSRMYGEHGVLILTCKASLFSKERDNAELMVADYWDTPHPAPTPADGMILASESDGTNTLTVTAEDGGATILTGSSKTLQVALTDTAGVKIPAPVVSYLLDAPAATARIVSESDGQVVVAAERNVRNIGKVTPLVVSADGITCRLNLTIKGVM